MSKMSFGKYTVDVSNEDKVFFPDAKITKGDLVEYYRKVADTMLPHLKDRTFSMQRFPDGLKKKGFYQKEAADYFPDWIKTVKVQKEKGSNTQVVIDKTATLVYLADQAMITPHIWLSRIDKPNHPDRLVIDLDPPDDDFKPVRNAAKKVIAMLDEELGLPVFIQTTGSRGLHVVVPLNRSEDFDAVRKFAKEVTDVLAERHPKELTTAVRKNKRQGRLFLDIARNAYAQTFVAPYSVRPRPGAPVATPLALDELGDAKLHSQKYTVKNIFRRLSQRDDPWKDINKKATSLKKARGRLGEVQGK